jgi:hypothetical protein
VSLFLLSALPSVTIGSFKFKKIDPLADIRIDVPQENLALQDSIENDSVKAKLDSAVQKVRLGCKEGITCIEDYSDDSTAMQNFLDAMSKQQYRDHPVRIAMYGDSFIEGDVFCGSFRDTLQTLFGGRGVGYVPLTSEVAGFRNTIKHSFGEWKTISLVSKKDSTLKASIGPAGFSFLPQSGNWVEYKPSKQRYLREFSIVRLFYKNQGEAELFITKNDTITDSVALAKTSRLKEWKMREEHLKHIKFEFDPVDSLELYGASFEDASGIYVDNFSMRGNSGIGLYNISDNMYEAFNHYRDYKLVILQYGLNVVREDSLRYGWYASKMIKVVNKIKSVFPTASILLISVSDRSTNTSGKFESMKSIAAMRNAQRYVAQQTGIAFWDLYEAMGGENSMIKFVESKPALAAKDYTHLTFKGGRKLSRALVNSLLYELEKYKDRDARQ